MKLITRLSKPFFVLAGAALVAACTSDPPAPSYPPIRFNDGTVLRLNVAEIDIVQAYKAPLKAPNAEHLFPVLLIVGLGSRLSAGALLVMTAVIQFFVYPGAWSTHLLWASTLAFIIFRGPGQLSVDHWLRGRLLG